VARAGLRARLAAAGLAGYPADPDAAARAGLAVLTWSAAAFVATGAAMWSQLAIGLQWERPDRHGVTEAMDLMSAGLLAVAVALSLAAIPVLIAAVGAVAAGRGRPLLRPAAVLAAGALVLVVGGRHFGNAWPGTGGHLLAGQSPVPGGVAAFGWATTMWISAYWAHPAALAAFPAGQLAWMALCPLAIGALCTGAARLTLRAGMPARALRYARKMSWLAAGGLGAFVTGAACWLGPAGPRAPLFQAGLIDRAGLAVLLTAALAGAAATRRTLAGVPVPAGHGAAGGQAGRQAGGQAGRATTGARRRRQAGGQAGQDSPARRAGGQAGQDSPARRARGPAGQESAGR